VKRSSVAALVARPTCFLCAQQAILAGRNLVDGSARLVKVEATPAVGHALALAGLAGCKDGTSSCGLIREANYDNEHQNWRKRHRGGIELDWRESEHFQRLEKDRLLEGWTRLAGDFSLAAQLSRLYSVSKMIVWLHFSSLSAMPKNAGCIPGEHLWFRVAVPLIICIE
jgi:hypothetical protein